MYSKTFIKKGFADRSIWGPFPKDRLIKPFDGQRYGLGYASSSTEEIY